MLVGDAVPAEGESPNQQRHSEPDPAEHGDPSQVGPGQAFLQRPSGEFRSQECRDSRYEPSQRRWIKFNPGKARN